MWDNKGISCSSSGTDWESVWSGKDSDDQDLPAARAAGTWHNKGVSCSSSRTDRESVLSTGDSVCFLFSAGALNTN